MTTNMSEVIDFVDSDGEWWVALRGHGLATFRDTEEMTP